MWNWIIPALIAAGGKKVQSDELEDAKRKRQRELLAGRKKARGREREQFQDVMDALNEVAPEARGVKIEEATAAHENRIGDAVAQILNEAPQGQGGERVSTARTTREAKNLSNLAKEASTIASIKARLRAPDDALRQQDTRMKQLRHQTNDAARDTSRIMQSAGQRADIVGRPNSSRMTLGGLAEGLGTSIATGQILGALKAPAAMKTGSMSMDPTYKPPKDFFEAWGVRK